MNDLYTLLQVRDELEKNYEFAKQFESAKHQWSGLLAARNTIHRMIQSAPAPASPLLAAALPRRLIIAMGPPPLVQSTR